MTDLIIGSRTDGSDSSVSLRAERFNRHTFWCGQSGSGKTYALGVVLEQLLLHTELPLLILDPNADFTRLNEVRSDADTEEARALAEIPVRILHSTSTDGEQVRARFTDLSVASRLQCSSWTPSPMQRNSMYCCTSMWIPKRLTTKVSSLGCEPATIPAN